MTAPRVAIVDSGGANLASLQIALGRLDATSTVTSDPTVLADSDRVILPGVGSARDAMQRLHSRSLANTILALSQPVLGICLGMQLLFDLSEEGATECLGILPGTVRRIPSSPGFPVPHMGWNTITRSVDDPLLDSIEDGSYFYFVHSYAAVPDRHCIARCDYSAPISAVARRGNFWGVQFHPERSGACGEMVLRNFLALYS
ncbi:MAG: imidazole glycerol phosphate synthase subunit HisH [Steroidobacteraceae bacterium]